MKYVSKGFLLLIVSSWFFIVGGPDFRNRNYWVVDTEKITFTESNRQLVNPNRGFYIMYGFIPSDEYQDLQAMVKERLFYDDRMLAMIQINLCHYTDTQISDEGLRQIDELFQGLRSVGKQYIVRFLYDWDGRNMETEPTDIEIILTHMRQLKNIFYEYADIIFVQQGLFIGNWGEMNGTKHYGFLTQLALQLDAVTCPKTFLAVRMPAQWRIATGLETLTEEARYKSSLACRLSLFNDGIMGNLGDYGTYGALSKEEVGIYNPWNREEELTFQEELCKFVPNGGEVIVENPVNDFENAIKDLSRMHLTYLNLDYDQNVLNKWKCNVIESTDCFNGMDGLSYIERHLGYRLLIRDVEFEYDFLSDNLNVKIDLQNVGFAPVYKEAEMYILIKTAETGVIKTFPVDAEIRTLTGGNEFEKLLTVEKHIFLTDFDAGEYEVYFYLKDIDSGKIIEFANEQNREEYGYFLGKMFLKTISLHNKQTK